MLSLWVRLLSGGSLNSLSGSSVYGVTGGGNSLNGSSSSGVTGCVNNLSSLSGVDGFYGLSLLVAIASNHCYAEKNSKR